MEIKNEKAINQKQISINMIANIVSYSSNLLISFVLTPFLINTLGKETYSFYPIANTIVSYFSVLTNSMNTMASRFVTVSLVKGETEEANKYYSSVLISNLIFGLILLIPMILVILFLDSFMEIPVNSVAAIKGLFSLVFASTLVNIIASIFGIATFAKNRIDLRSLRELVTAVLRLVLFVLFYKFLPASIIYVGIVTLIVAFVNVGFQYNYTKMLLLEIHISKQNFSWVHTKSLLGASAWNTINSFGNVLLVGMSLIMANLFYGATAAGTYSIVQTVPQFVNGIISMLVGVFFPVITYKYAQNNKEELIKEIANAQKMIGLVACATIVVFSALAKEFFTLWTPNEDASYLSLLSLLTILPHLFIACLWSLTNLNVVMNKVKVPANFTLCIGVINVFLAWGASSFFHFNLVALPIISTSLQILWIGIFIPQYACKILNVKWITFYGPVVKAICCSIPTTFIVIFLKQFFYINSWIKFIIFGGLMGCCTLVIFSLGMLGPKYILKTLKRVLEKLRRV